MWNASSLSFSVLRVAALALVTVAAAPSVNAQFLVKDQEYRCPPSQDCKNLKPAFQELHTSAGNPYTINFVEYKDNGASWNSRELDDAVEQVKDARGDGSQGVLVMVYIHGWQNNADEQEGSCNDVCRFRDHLLATLADQYSASRGTPLRVVGVYLAWRGLTFTVEPFKHIVSYWGRRGVARRVGQTGMFDALTAIEGAVAQKRENYVLVFAGHSFGARVLENAAEVHDKRHKGFMLQYRESTKKLASNSGKFLMSQEQLKQSLNHNLPADLIVYINAATASTVTRKTIKDIRNTCATVPEAPICGANPLYLALTSHADLATGIIMPIANLVFPAFSSDGIHIISAANTPWMHTHRTHTPGCDADSSLCFQVGNPTVSESLVRIDRQSEIPGTANNPFWIFNVNHEVIANHGDVWNDAVIDLVTRAITKTKRVHDIRETMAQQKAQLQ